MKKQILTAVLFFLAVTTGLSQTYKPDLQDKTQVIIGDRPSTKIDFNGKKAIKIEEGKGNTVMLLNNVNLANGTIEFDCKGRNVIGSSFVGIAFHVQEDGAYDAIYFRPFNFSNPDTVRRWRAVQYISMPKYDWESLRNQFPGKYENKVNPVPGGDDWFHCKITVKGPVVTVYVNNSPKPSLVVNKLTNTTKGKVGLWVETGCDGSFANLEIRNE